MKENNFFRINFNDAVDSKRNILTSQINVLKSKEHIKKIIILKKKKQIIDNQLKADIRLVIKQMDSLLLKFPKEKQNLIKETISKSKKAKKETMKEELSRIKDDLERLNRNLNYECCHY